MNYVSKIWPARGTLCARLFVWPGQRKIIYVITNTYMHIFPLKLFVWLPFFRFHLWKSFSYSIFGTNISAHIYMHVWWCICVNWMSDYVRMVDFYFFFCFLFLVFRTGPFDSKLRCIIWMLFIRKSYIISNGYEHKASFASCSKIWWIWCMGYDC